VFNENEEIMVVNSSRYWVGDTLRISQLEEDVRMTPRKLKALREARNKIDELLKG